MSSLAAYSAQAANEPFRAKLDRLRERLAAEQRRLILHAAEADMLPAAGTLERIAHIETAIVATEAIIVEQEDEAERAATAPTREAAIVITKAVVKYPPAEPREPVRVVARFRD